MADCQDSVFLLIYILAGWRCRDGKCMIFLEERRREEKRGGKRKGNGRRENVGAERVRLSWEGDAVPLTIIMQHPILRETDITIVRHITSRPRDESRSSEMSHARSSGSRGNQSLTPITASLTEPWPCRDATRTAG